MAILTIDNLVAALGNTAQSLMITKASIAAQLAGGYSSLFRATGVPGQGAIPAAAAVCDNTLLGALAFANPTDGSLSYLARLTLNCSNNATDVQIHDRLSHMGGLNGTVTTAQTAGVSCAVTTSNMSARIGDTDYSEVMWWLEWYAATGATAVTATISYTNAAGVSGKTTTVSIPASIAAGRMIPIVGANGEFIQSVQTVTLSASTATAGSFGITATRFLTSLQLTLANSTTMGDWATLGLPRIFDSSCLTMIQIPSTTSTGNVNGAAKLIQG